MNILLLVAHGSRREESNLEVESLSKKEDFKSLFYEIYKLGYSRSFFETGLTFINSLLNYKLLNILYILQNNKMLKKNGFKKT